MRHRRHRWPSSRSSCRLRLVCGGLACLQTWLVSYLFTGAEASQQDGAQGAAARWRQGRRGRCRRAGGRRRRLGQVWCGLRFGRVLQQCGATRGQHGSVAWALGPRWEGQAGRGTVLPPSARRRPLHVSCTLRTVVQLSPERCSPRLPRPSFPAAPTASAPWWRKRWSGRPRTCACGEGSRQRGRCAPAGVAALVPAKPSGSPGCCPPAGPREACASRQLTSQHCPTSATTPRAPPCSLGDGIEFRIGEGGDGLMARGTLPKGTQRK